MHLSALSGFFAPLFMKPMNIARPRIHGEATDRELVARMQRGDRWAEEAFYRKHVTSVTVTVRRLLNHTHDAEETVQDTFVTAFEEIERLREADSARSWLLSIAVRKVHRRFRRRKLLRAFGLDRGLDDVTLESVASQQLSLEQRSELRAIDRVLSTLPIDVRTAWMLRHVDGERLDDVATICDCSLATVKRRVAAGDERLRAHIEGSKS